MRIIEPSYEILTEISEGGIKELQHIEKIGRGKGRFSFGWWKVESGKGMCAISRKIKSLKMVNLLRSLYKC